ncbi:MAG: hypothetical protein FWE57_05420 [Chitinispirillia bacterium]|nr:hypothetical protein [Chitinispirillia bacterium]
MKLKATGGWYNNGNGTDDYGFSALPAGRFQSDNTNSNWWTTSYTGDNASDAYDAWSLSVYHDSAGAYEVAMSKSNEFPVRCLKN